MNLLRGVNFKLIHFFSLKFRTIKKEEQQNATQSLAAVDASFPCCFDMKQTNGFCGEKYVSEEGKLKDFQYF